MQKTLEFLEKNVQWFAIGLGAIFLLWAAYAYLLNPPASVKIGSHVLVPGEVAPFTNGGPVKDLTAQMNDKTPISFPSPDVIGSWQTAFNPAPQTGGTLVAYAFDSQTSGGIITDDHKNTGGNDSVHFAVLPVLPPAAPQAVVSGLSTVSIPPPPPPASASGRTARAVAPPPPTSSDLVWNTASFTISADALAKAFQAPLNGINPNMIDPHFFETVLLAVKVERQQSIGTTPEGKPLWPDGSKAQVVAPLKIYASQMRQLPAENASQDEKYQYRDWATNNFALIAQPQFYSVTAGSPWAPPAASDENGATTASTAPATQPVTPQTGPASGSASVELADASDNQYANPYNQNYPRGRSRYRGPYPADPRFGGRPPIPQPGFNQNPNGQMQGQLNPLDLPSDLQVWANDESVAPGKTYRYRVTYYMMNPIYNVSGVAAPDLINQFAMTSPPSPWSDPVTTPLTTKFWISKVNREQVEIDVFHYNQGKWDHAAAKLQPGDLVPNTDWSVVDVRLPESGSGARDQDKYVLLTDNAGTISLRNQQTDRDDPKYQEMKDLAGIGQPAVTPETAPPSTARPPVPPRSRRPLRGPPLPPPRG